MIIVELKLSSVETYLLREALMNTIVNADNFSEYEKEYLQEIYNRIKEHQENLDNRQKG